MGQIIGNALSSGNYRTMASVARSQGRAQQAAYNLKANNLEEEARADSRLAALNMSRMRENQASNQASARVRQASSGFAAEGSSMQNELALADVFEKSIADMALSNALSDSGKRTAAMASRQQGRLSMMQADAQAGQYNRLAKSARNAAWIQGLPPSFPPPEASRPLRKKRQPPPPRREQAGRRRLEAELRQGRPRLAPRSPPGSQAPSPRASPPMTFPGTSSNGLRAPSPPAGHLPPTRAAP
ncbi:hypothetical protein ABFY27_10445 [Akkermansia massiliensis]